MLPFLNIHTHRKPQSPQEVAVRNAYLPKKFSEMDLPYPVSVGIHPWFIAADWEKQIETMGEILAKNKVTAIGEIGLDRAIATPFSIQATLLEAQIAITQNAEKPYIIHCVRAYSDFSFFLKQIKTSVIFHDFQGNKIQVQQLLKYDVYFSFGKSLFSLSSKLNETLATIPPERLFLETDTSPILIQSIYNQLSTIKSIPVETLKTIFWENQIRIGLLNGG